MNYRHVYMLIIEHAKSEQKLGIRVKGNGQYYEKHHILPKSIYPLWKKQSKNLVLLTAREHFFCHQLLTKIFPCQETFCAAYMLASTNQGGINITSREYEKLRIQRSKFCGDWVRKSLTGRKLEDYYTDKAYIEWRKQQCGLGAKNRSKESLERMSAKLSLALKGRVSPTKGKKWFNNGKEQAMLFECPEGWVSGRLNADWCKSTTLGKKAYTDGKVVKMFGINDVIPDGLILGTHYKEV